MKRLFSFCALAFALFATSCSQDSTYSEPLPLQTLNFYVDSEASRVDFDSTTHLYEWTGDERLGVYVASAAPTPNTYADVELRDGKAYCSATTNAYAAGDKMYVYYPFSDANDGLSVNAVRVSIPSRQSVVAGEFDATQMPMVASPVTLGATVPTVYMRPLASLLCFRIYASGKYAGEKVSSISYADKTKALAGQFTIDATQVGGEKWGLTGGDANLIMVSLPEPYAVSTTKEAAKSIYMVLAPNNYSGSLVVTTDKAVYTYDYAREVARNTYYNVNINLSNATSRKSLDGELGGGDGSAANPYIIDEAADLVLLSTKCAAADAAYIDKCYRQVCDIDLSASTFTPIGTDAARFAGTYDGGNFVVSGITIAESNSAPCGMFAYTEGATIRGVVIENFTNKGTGGCVGGVVGKAYNSVIENCTMDSNLSTTVTISGGIVAYLYGGKVINCSTTERSTIKSITTEWAQSGGIVGYALGGASVEGCTMSGNVASMNKRIGGIVGDLRESSTVKNCRFTTTAEVFNNAHSCGGIVGGHYSDSVVDNCIVEGTVGSQGQYCGGISGYFPSGIIKNCRVTAAATVSSYQEHCGGIAGIVGYTGDNVAKVEDCVIEGDMSVQHLSTGGIAGRLYAGSSIINSTVKESVEIQAFGENCGGIVGLQSGGTIKNCVMEGDLTLLSNGQYGGGIVGLMNEGEILDCTVQRTSSISVNGICAGGVVGVVSISTASVVCLIDGCTVYADVKGFYDVGGLVGYAKPNTEGSKLIIANSVYAYGEISSTGLNSNNYNLAGGVIGWLHGTTGVGEVQLANLAIRPSRINCVAEYAGNKTLLGVAGIVGFRNRAKTVGMTCLYTDFNKDKLYIGGKSFAESGTTATLYGSLFGSTNGMTANGYFYDGSIQLGAPSQVSKVTMTNSKAVTPQQMSDGTLLALLNSAASSASVAGVTMRSWKADAEGYPTIATAPACNAQPSQPSVAAPKRVSVIGDSISTYRGYIPYGYGAHYPTTDGDLNLVGQTYWYRLIYDHMQNARLERNIAMSATAVARTTNTAYESKTWFGYDYCARFIAQNGVGNPDIVIIHGGTNDYGHNCDQLISGVAMRSTTPASDSALEALYATAAAATTRAEVEALNDTTFCEAYIKLICLIRERNPQAKIVCIVGDCVGAGMQGSIHKIAAHYNAKVVDLLAVNGYNDQVYMPKHDYNPSTGSGCHPSSKAMEFIANKIYTELGQWLEN